MANSFLPSFNFSVVQASMGMRRSAVLAGTCILAGLSLPPVALAACAVESGPMRAALVELYTSEGCSSCPPADQQLRQLIDSNSAQTLVVPIALHVDYWDYIGWQDRFAQSGFGIRQRALSQGGTVYTPQFFINGSVLHSWRGALQTRLREINSTPAKAHISLHGRMAAGDMLSIDAEASTTETDEPAALYLAIAENGLVSKVSRGENSGSTLSHDHVVRLWIGPLPLKGGHAVVQRQLKLAPEWARKDLEVLGFIQSTANRSVLQAVRALSCAAS